MPAWDSLEEELGLFLSRQRWFGGTAGAAARITWTAELGGDPPLFVLEADGYQLPVVVARGADVPNQSLVIGEVDGLVAYDALADPTAAGRLLSLLATGQPVGGMEFVQRAEIGPTPGPARLIAAEQSNTSVVFGDSLILKWFRRVTEGPQPDVEVTEALARAAYPHIARPLGLIRRGTVMVALLQEFLAGSEDGWSRALETARGEGRMLDEAAELGTATAGLHAALSSIQEEGFGSRAATAEDLDEWAQSMRAELHQVGGELHAYRSGIEGVFESVRAIGSAGQVTRVHGDYHLGQVLRHQGDWVVIDFEGEPSVALEKRRAGQSPLVDVAGMLRSFEYVAATAGTDEDWAVAHRAAFLDAYRAAVPSELVPGPSDFDLLLRAFELRKAVYEVGYERAHRPAWVRIPLAAVERMASA